MLKSFRSLTYPHPLLDCCRVVGYDEATGGLPVATTDIAFQPEAGVEQLPERCTIPVAGMHCAGCSSRVQLTLEQTPGVREANVNLMTGSATVDYDPATVSAQALVDVIRGTGYGAELPAPALSVEKSLDEEDAARAEEIG